MSSVIKTKTPNQKLLSARPRRQLPKRSFPITVYHILTKNSRWKNHIYSITNKKGDGSINNDVTRPVGNAPNPSLDNSIPNSAEKVNSEGKNHIYAITNETVHGI